MYAAVSEGRTERVRESELVPAPIAALCRRALSRDPGERFESARRFELSLHAARSKLGLDDPSDEQVAAWARRLLPPGYELADLEREIVEGRVGSAGRGAADTPSAIADLPTQAAE